jgi:hypothetical protein
VVDFDALPSIPIAQEVRWVPEPVRGCGEEKKSPSIIVV